MADMWHSVSQLFPGARTAYQKEHALANSYRRVFKDGGDSKEDREMVLADLAQAAGWSMVTPPEADDKTLRHNEGKRTLYSRILGFLTLGPEDISELERAARIEAATRQTYPA